MALGLDKITGLPASYHVNSDSVKGAAFNRYTVAATLCVGLAGAGFAHFTNRSMAAWSVAGATTGAAAGIGYGLVQNHKAQKTQTPEEEEEIDPSKPASDEFNVARKLGAWFGRFGGETVMTNEAGFKADGTHYQTKTEFDPNGFNARGYNEYGFNAEGIHRITETEYDLHGFKADKTFGDSGQFRDDRGFDIDGKLENGRTITDDGYDFNGDPVGEDD